MNSFLACCSRTLQDVEMANLDQDTFKSDVANSLSKCWNLEFLDISGCRHVDDQFFTIMQKGEIMVDKKPVAPGLSKLITVKLSYTGIQDMGVMTLVKIAPNIEHLELNRLDGLQEFTLKLCFKDLPKLRFWDLNGVTGVTYQMLDEFK